MTISIAKWCGEATAGVPVRAGIQLSARENGRTPSRAIEKTIREPAVWIDNVQTNTNRTVNVQVGPIVPSTEPGVGRKLAIPIVVTTSNVTRNRVDPSTWDAIRRVGRYSDTTQNASLRVDIECFVDNPADV